MMFAVPSSAINSSLDYFDRRLANFFRKRLTDYFNRRYLSNMNYYKV